ncbi:MAG: hypothetical protein IKY72_01630, partial [Bacteroidaceae bacterium]|nr:hypothetical protein [Bacteroidaceae bacterium]
MQTDEISNLFEYFRAKQSPHQPVNPSSRESDYDDDDDDKKCAHLQRRIRMKRGEKEYGNKIYYIYI